MPLKPQIIILISLLYSVQIKQQEKQAVITFFLKLAFSYFQKLTNRPTIKALARLNDEDHRSVIQTHSVIDMRRGGENRSIAHIPEILAFWIKLTRCFTGVLLP